MCVFLLINNLRLSSDNLKSTINSQKFDIRAAQYSQKKEDYNYCWQIIWFAISENDNFCITLSIITEKIN